MTFMYNIAMITNIKNVILYDPNATQSPSPVIVHTQKTPRSPVLLPRQRRQRAAESNVLGVFPWLDPQS